MTHAVDQAWEEPYLLIREEPANPSATSMDMAFEDTDDISGRPMYPGGKSVKVAVFVASQPGRKETDPDLRREVREYYWFSTGYPMSNWPYGGPVVYEVLDGEHMGFPEETAGSVYPFAVRWQQSESQPADLRGVFLTHYPRKVLFTKPMTFRTSDLPHWKPKNIIGLRAFDEEDD